MIILIKKILFFLSIVCKIIDGRKRPYPRIDIKTAWEVITILEGKDD